MATKSKDLVKKDVYQTFLIDYVLNPDVIRFNITQISEELGVTRPTIYLWLDCDETVKAMDGNIHRNRIERRKALHASALTGNPAAIKLEEQIVENWSEKSEQKITGTIEVNPDIVAKLVQESLDAIKKPTK